MARNTDGQGITDRTPEIAVPGQRRGPKEVQQVTVERPLCPVPKRDAEGKPTGEKCGSDKYDRYKTSTIDGSNRKVFCTCFVCGGRFSFLEHVEYVSPKDRAGEGE